MIQESIGLPNTVQGFIANCVDRPKQAEQMTIKTASVLGPIFNAGMVYE
jgi:hypothetical protein